MILISGGSLMNKKILKTTLIVALSLILMLPLRTGADDNVKFEIVRIADKGRIETSIRVSSNAFDTSDYVIITNGYNFPDALAGGPLASALNAPILLTAKESLSDAVLKEIIELGASKAIILGSEGSVTKRVAEQLNVVADVERIGGGDRYETAALIAERVMNITGTTSVAVTNGHMYPDALSASAYLGANGIPIVLVAENSIPIATQKFLDHMDINKTIVVGGVKTVSGAVMNNLINPERIAGSNRFETSIALSKKAYKNPSNVVLVNAYNFPDALSAAGLTSKYKAPILLTAQDALPKNIKNYLEQIKPRRVLMVGGKESISTEIAGELLDSFGELNGKPQVPEFSPQEYNEEYAKEMAEIINKLRTDQGLEPFVWDSGLEAAAKIRAKEIVENLSHTRPNGENFSTVNKEQIRGENLAILNAYPKDVIDIMMSASGQSSNLLRKEPYFKAIGIACWADSEGKAHWVQMFGVPK